MFTQGGSCAPVLPFVESLYRLQLSSVAVERENELCISIEGRNGPWTS